LGFIGGAYPAIGGALFNSISLLDFYRSVTFIAEKEEKFANLSAFRNLQ
jgi:hypothetical protein